MECLQGDFTQEEVINLLKERLTGKQADLVISDLAPDISGIAAADQAKTMQLGELALEFCRRVLRPGGCFLVKSFHGSGYQEFYARMKQDFKTMAVRKPKASRSRSQEVYLLGKDFHAQ